MKRKLSAFIGIILVTSTVTLCGDLRHALDPRGKIENIVGEGDFIWDMDEQKLADRMRSYFHFIGKPGV